MKQQKKYTIITGALMCILWSSCKKFVQVPSPITSINSQNVYTENSSATAVLTGIYIEMTSQTLLNESAASGLSLYAGLSADELTVYSGLTGDVLLYYQNDISKTTGTSFWTNGAYSYIFLANSAIEGLTGSSANSLTQAVRQQLLGEAYFIRAMQYFYLTNLFGDVPLLLTTNYQTNELAARTSQNEVYKQIFSDLNQAISLLNSNFLASDAMSTTTERTRPSKWAAEALLARVYLFYGDLTSNADGTDYKNAETYATNVINNSAEFSLVPLNDVFLKNSNEAIWQLQATAQGWNTQDAQIFIVPSTGFNNQWPVYLSNFLMNSFEAGDQRKTDWTDTVSENGITYHYPYKYKSATRGAPVTEYEMVLRLGEQYLIRAEAAAHLGDQYAVSDLNAVRNRAGLANYNGSKDQASLLAAILHERQVELFTEYGSRWLDLKRTGTLNAVMSQVAPAKGGTWSPYKGLYPVPLSDIQLDRNLIQNPGY